VRGCETPAGLPMAQGNQDLAIGCSCGKTWTIARGVPKNPGRDDVIHCYITM
jgi:hypothetical protein